MPQDDACKSFTSLSTSSQSMDPERPLEFNMCYEWLSDEIAIGDSDGSVSESFNNIQPLDRGPRSNSNLANKTAVIHPNLSLSSRNVSDEVRQRDADPLNWASEDADGESDGFADEELLDWNDEQDQASLPSIQTTPSLPPQRAVTDSALRAALTELGDFRIAFPQNISGESQRCISC